MAEFAVILVHSTSHAVRAEQILKKEGIEAKLIPVPRSLSSDCGTAVRIRSRERETAERLLTDHRAPFERICGVRS